MLKSVLKARAKSFLSISLKKRTFLSNDYKCNENWNSAISSPLLNKINLNDFYNKLDQTHSSKGIISAIDVDIFANAVTEPVHLEELKDLLHKLRLSAETGSMLESTSHATVRHSIKFDYVDELIQMLKDPLNYGLFLDDYSANILLNELLVKKNYTQAADIAALIMLQEEYNNDILCSLCQYSSYMFIKNYVEPEPAVMEENNKKVEEIKIRVKFLRNPYFDDHFDIKDRLKLAGKTLAWISEKTSNTLNNNLQLIGWLIYKKYDQLLATSEELCTNTKFRIYNEVIDLLNKELHKVEPEKKEVLEKCISLLAKIEIIPTKPSLQASLTDNIENAINKTQEKDVAAQKELFILWEKTRQLKLEEQSHRLDRVKRVQIIEEKQRQLQEEEQKLWFFENEEKIDLQIEDKEKLVDKTQTKKKVLTAIDENYIPPEILPKRR
ncbi:uncharacterized protein LOC101745964 [Bombyx mori]|uniref:28S ribosomal protein S27, mitochondrial n=1 Tax=Bombyx mori TaxID=7091 RepID=A0A8R1WHZ8_BOMMO|nr:uncharacterized protein LOC101745964 [Bombyx mori]